MTVLLKGAIVDPATERAASVGDQGDLLFSSTGTPRFSLPTRTRPHSEFFVNEAGSANMLVDGSVTPVKFTVEALSKRDRYIKTISFLISDAGASLSDFGNIAALTEGVLFEWETEGETVELAVIKTNFNAVQLAGGQPAFGSTTAAFRASNVVGTSDAYLPVLDFATMFGLPWGLKLGAGSDERLVITIRDDIQAIDAMNVLSRGFDLLPVERS